jgi:hypothetical protein
MMISQSTIIAKPRAPALDAGTQRGGRFIENFLVRRRKVAAFEGVSWRMEGRVALAPTGEPLMVFSRSSRSESSKCWGINFSKKESRRGQAASSIEPCAHRGLFIES